MKTFRKTSRTAQPYADAIVGQIEEGCRKGFDFGRNSFFTRTLKARITGLARMDATLADEMYDYAFGASILETARGQGAGNADEQALLDAVEELYGKDEG